MTPHLVDTTLFYTATSGGVRRYLLEKHAWFRRSAHWQHTLLVPGAQDRGSRGDIVEFQSPLIRAGYRWPVRLAAFRERLATLEPDLIEAADPYVVGWQAARAAERLGIPSIAFCHSELVGLVRGRAGPAGAAAAAAYLRTLYARFTRVLAPSQVVARQLHDAGIHSVAVQPLGVDADVFSPARRDPNLRAQLGLPADTRLLIFAGRLAPEKNLPHLYAMIEQLRAPYHLLIVGGTTAGRNAPRVTTLPYQAEPLGLATLLASADLLVHAGQQETFGLVALEALACGTPVVAYRHTALAELVDAGVGALAHGYRPAALAEAVDAIFSGDIDALGRAARERALKCHTWPAVFSQQRAFYERLLSAPWAPAHDRLRLA